MSSVSVLHTGVSNNLKIEKYIVYLSNTLTNALKGNSIQKLMIFERKILRKIFGPTKEPNGLWRIKTNEELDELIQQKNHNKIYQISNTKTVRPCRKDAKG